jgi:DNA-binding transcriptional regulator GbsR (MarR family)
MAESFSLNRSVGQIYGLLYASSHPLSLQEISAALHMSKGNASIHLRTLEAWEAVKCIWVPGSRQDHYEAIRDLKKIILKRVEQGMTKRLDMIESRFNALAENKGMEDPFLKEQIKSLRGMLSSARKGLSLMPKITGFFS